MKYYDHIISLGHCCHTAISLKDCHLQGASNVFDWSAGILFDKCGIGGFEGKINLICNHFDNFLNFEDFEEFDTGHICHRDVKNRSVRNKRTGLQYLHDFPITKSIAEEWDNFCSKYNRRIKRLYEVLQSSDSVCFLFITRTENISTQIIIDAHKRCSQLFGKKIDFCIFQHDGNLNNDVYFSEIIDEHINRIHFNNQFIKINDGRMNRELYQRIINEIFLTKYKIDYLLSEHQSMKDYITKLEGKISDTDLTKCKEGH